MCIEIILSQQKSGIILRNEMSKNWNYPKMSKVVHLNENRSQKDSEDSCNIKLSLYLRSILQHYEYLSMNEI